VSLLLALIPVVSVPGQVRIDDPKDQEIIQKFLKHVEDLPDRIDVEYCRRMAAAEPEGYTWKILPRVEMALTAYELTGDDKYLDVFVATFANLRTAMTEGLDGYLGWYLGWYGKALRLFRDPADPDKKVDVIISSFRATGMLARFLELVAQGEELKAKFAGTRAEYLDLIANHLVKKWDARGCFVDLGKTGAIYRTHPGLKDVKGNLTQPHNKHSIILQALLNLYRVTGNDEYMEKAVRLGTRFKNCLTLKNGHYEWNYWDPAGSWDIDPNDPNRWKHWIGPEHRSGYYSHSLTQAVVLYHHGLVFDQTDLERFLKTQLEMTWNGDLDNPQWYRVDRSRGQQTGAYICPALAPYDQRIYAFLYTGLRQQERIERAGHSWQGGPVANGWLYGKFLYVPATTGGKRIHLDAGKKFLASPKNRDFYEGYKFEVTDIGYRPPRSPDQYRTGLR